MSGTRAVLSIAFGFIFIGIVFAGISIGVSRNISHKKKVCTQQVAARVVDIKRIKNRSMDTNTRSSSWYPVYEYWADNQNIRVRSHVGGLKDTFQIGQRVDLLINPEKVSEFYNPSDQAGLLQKIFLAVGLVLIAAGIGTAVIGRRFIR